MINMKYYLVSNSEIELQVYNNDSKSLVMKKFPANTVSNSIAYDGKSEYSPPSGMKLVSSENNFNIRINNRIIFI